uniref:Capsid protein n=1 Tax=uncultured marine virus TaxID=186617 RepID=A0A1J0KKL3_9VIRU|nr:hypothetical protein [uncultured marine virus]
MPYGRRKRYKPKASNLRKWKKKLRRTTKGGYNTRQTLANAKAIKQLKRRPELKFQNSVIASTANNFVGQNMRPTAVSNWGLPQSTNDWVAAGASATNLSAEKYCPVILRPVCCGQGKYSPNLPNPWATPATLDDVGSGENERVGNKITMHSLHIRGLITGGNMGANIGAYTNSQVKQKVTFVLVLDRQPNPGQVNAGTGVYNTDAVPCQLYPCTLDNFLANPYKLEQQENLRSIANAQTPATTPYFGPKLLTQIGADLEKQSYYSKDQVLGTSGRFKILQKKTFSVMQTPTNTLQLSTRCTVPFSWTYKSRHKFHFASDRAITPTNQSLLLFMYSDTPVLRSANGAAPLNGIAPPYVAVVSRFQWKDE